MENHVKTEDVVKEAITAVENDGIVFIDEIDKICTSPENRHSGDASSEGVQRDLLPIIEGCTISTKHGNVKTDHILFVASGAFSACKPSDLLAELQVFKSVFTYRMEIRFFSPLASSWACSLGLLVAPWATPRAKCLLITSKGQMST